MLNTSTECKNGKSYCVTVRLEKMETVNGSGSAMLELKCEGAFLYLFIMQILSRGPQLFTGAIDGGGGGGGGGGLDREEGSFER